MTNAEKFKEVFGVYATETWAMPESDFLLWLNGEYNGEERRTGKWIRNTNGRGGHECNQCNEYAPSTRCGTERLSPYCPNCGVKMEVDDG